MSINWKQTLRLFKNCFCAFLVIFFLLTILYVLSLSKPEHHSNSKATEK